VNRHQALSGEVKPSPSTLTMSEVEATLQRINSHKGVLGTIIVNDEGQAIRTTADAAVTAQYAEFIPQLASMARSLVRDLDPQNDLQFLRIRSRMHEIMGTRFLYSWKGSCCEHTPCEPCIEWHSCMISEGVLLWVWSRSRRV